MINRRSFIKSIAAFGFGGMISPCFGALAKDGLPTVSKPKRPTNILLISLDTLRADYLGCYGSEVHTPNIDKFASSGALFENAYCHIPITLPSHVSMFTSKYPHETKIVNNAQKMPNELYSLPEMLGDQGFDPDGIISLGTLDLYTNFNQGFSSYSDTGNVIGSFKKAEQVTNEFIRWLDGRNNKKKWFLFLHYSDPHEPYHAHALGKNNIDISLNGKTIGQLNISQDNFLNLNVALQPGKNTVVFRGTTQFHIRRFHIDSKEVVWKAHAGLTKKSYGYLSERESAFGVENNRDKNIWVSISLFLSEKLSIDETKRNYQKEVEYLDRNIGEVITALNERQLFDNTLILLTADHGEGLGDHNLIGHISQLYDTLLKIPLVISYPKKIQRGARFNARVRHIDILPTIMDLCGMDSEGELEGESLVPITEGKQTNDRPVIGMTFKPEAPNDLISLTRGEYKIIKNLNTNEDELYHLKTDPYELTDIHKTDFLAYNRMEMKLMKVIGTELLTNQEMTTQTDSQILDQEIISKLRELGYIR